MNGRVYGYMRVSTIDQNEARQRADLLAYGVNPENIYMDKLSGRNFERPEYRRLRRKLREGDIMVVKSIDRFGRDYVEIQSEWKYIVKEKHADIVILDMPLLDTRQARDLVGTLISDIVLQLLSFVAETERTNIRRRQAEGIAEARKRGVHFGRMPEPVTDEFVGIYNEWKAGALTLGEAMELSGMSENRFKWMARKYRSMMSGIPLRPGYKAAAKPEKR